MSEIYYERFYGFDSPPFHITPDASLLFPTETHQQAMGAIEYGITSDKGFIVVTGEVGVGKTTILRMCLNRLDSSNIKVIYIFNPTLTISELYVTILDELDVSVAQDISNRPAALLRKLLEALLASHKSGLRVVLAVDEAQNMPEKTLEGLRILSNLETSKYKLLQIILVGQPEFATTLAKHSLRQLTQRVAVRARITRLTLRQSRRYIQYRCQHAGRNKPPFTAPALWYLALRSRGIARSLNICCDNALINGYGYAAERISLRIAHESCRSLQFRSPSPRVAIFSTAIAIALTLFMMFYVGPTSRGFVALLPGGKTIQIASSLVGNDDLAGHAKVADPAAPPFVIATPPLSPVSVPTADATASAHPKQPTADTIIVASPAVASAEAPNPSTNVGDEPNNFSSVAPPQKPSDSSDTVINKNQKAQSTWKWLVRRGDTVIKACRATYGQCDEQALRTILAYNPQIGSDGFIHQGMVIIMPEQIELPGPNSE